MSDAAGTIADYVAAWNTDDVAERAGLLERCWASGARYVDPNVDLHGAVELSAHIQRMRVSRPGCHIELVGGIAVHHDVASFAWRLLGPDGSTGRDGIDAVEFAADGRLRQVTGFFGGSPPWALH